MNCYNHHEKPAVGTCKSCCKGLCPNCVSEVPNGIACKNSCEKRVEMIDKIINKNNKVFSVANRNSKNSASFSVLAGLLFLGWGIWELKAMPQNIGIGFFLMTIGIIYTIFGALRFGKKSQFPVNMVKDKKHGKT